VKLSAYNQVIEHRFSVGGDAIEASFTMSQVCRHETFAGWTVKIKHQPRYLGIRSGLLSSLWIDIREIGPDSKVGKIILNIYIITPCRAKSFQLLLFRVNSINIVKI
jgi:hypothetical protein